MRGLLMIRLFFLSIMILTISYFAFDLPAFSQETITLTTYYPAPHGVYNILKTNYLQMGVHDTDHGYDYLRLLKADGDPVNGYNDIFAGFMYNNNGTTPWGDGDDFTIFTYENPTTGSGRDINIHARPAASPAYVYLSGAGVGIAHTPSLLNGVENRLEVWGPTVIGATYTSDGTVGPANGLLVEGRVGIGTRTPSASLDVRGDSILVPRRASNPSGINGKIYYNTTSREFRFYENNLWKSIGGGSLHMAKMVRNSAQNIADSGTHRISLNSQVFDYGGIAQPGTGRFVIQQSGVYMITAYWRCGQFARSHRQAGDSELATYIYINGAERGQSDSFVKGPVNETGYALVQDVYRLNSGDIVTMHVRHTAGGTRATQTGAGGRPRMSVVQLR